MKKNKKSTTKKSTYVSRRKLICALVLTIIINVAIVASVSVAFLDHLDKREDSNSVSKVAFLVIEANRETMQDTPVASYSSDLFIDEARVSFTKVEGVELVHSYSLAYDDSVETIYLSDSRLIENISGRI